MHRRESSGTLTVVDLRHPLRSIVPSLDADVLEVLAGVETGLGLSQITRLAARGSRMGISHVVNRLVEHGVVLAEPANQGYLYRLNRDHVLAPVVLAGATTRQTLLTRLAERALDLMPAPIHVSVVGSFARGEAGPDSDIDLLVVVATEAELDKLDDQLRQLAAEVTDWTGNDCQVLAFTTRHLRSLRSSGERAVDSWLDDSRLLVGTELAAVLRSPHTRPGQQARASSTRRR